MASKRQIKDYQQLVADGAKSGIYIKDVSAAVNKPPYMDLRMMLIGPDGPYKNCLFFFRIFFTQKYPFMPPTVQFLCPFSIRCHPNLYQYYPGPQQVDSPSNGKVCFSILGTFGNDPPWGALMSLETIAQTILSVLDDTPLRNEPSFANSSTATIQPYTNYVRWICLKESIPLWTKPLPEMYAIFQDEVTLLLETKRDELVGQIIKLSEEFDGKTIHAVHYGNKTDDGKEYNYTSLLNCLM